MKPINPFKMTYDEAYDRYLKARQRVQDFWRGGIDLETLDENEEYQEAKRQQDLLLGYLRANPEFFKRERSWMIDVHGTGRASNVCDDDMEQCVADMDNDPREAIAEMLKKQGPLVQDVQDFIRENEWYSPDRGGGCDGWHIGIHATSEQVPVICAKLRERYAIAIDHGIIYLTVQQWSSSFEKPMVTA